MLCAISYGLGGLHSIRLSRIIVPAGKRRMAVVRPRRAVRATL
jgi:hypothetical protein